MQVPLDFELENVGRWPNPLVLGTTAADNDFVALLFQRDYYCTNCRKQVQVLADRYEEFRAAGAEVVSIVPEPASDLEVWQAKYDLPFPLWHPRRVQRLLRSHAEDRGPRLPG